MYLRCREAGKWRIAPGVSADAVGESSSVASGDIDALAPDMQDCIKTLRLAYIQTRGSLDRTRVPALAFDSKEYHAGELKHFFAPIGLGIETRDSGSFKEAYDEALKGIFEDLGIERRRRSYSFGTLVDFFKDRAGKIVNRFLSDVADKVSRVWFFHTQVSEIKTPYIYSRGKYGRLPPLEYMKIHQQAYPYWCAWRLSKEGEIRNTAILLDAFQSPETNAWNDLKVLRPLIFYKGDEVNPLISTADILLARADQDLREHILRDPFVEKVFANLGYEVASLFIGQPHYREITAISRLPISLREYVPRPMVYILHEARPKGVNPKDWERARFLAPVSDAPLNLAFDENVGCKAFDFDQDGGLLNSRRDIFFLYGPDGKGQRDKLIPLYRVPAESFREV